MPIADLTQYPYLTQIHYHDPSQLYFVCWTLSHGPTPDFKPGPFDPEVNHNSNLEEDWLCESHVHQTLWCILFWRVSSIGGLTATKNANLRCCVFFVVPSHLTIGGCYISLGRYFLLCRYLASRRQNLSIKVHTSSSCSYWICTKTSICNFIPCAAHSHLQLL